MSKGFVNGRHFSTRINGGIAIVFEFFRMRIAIVLIGLAFVLAGCAHPPEVTIEITPDTPPTQIGPTPEPTEIPPPPKTLVVCLGRAPASLYLYGEASPEADTVLQAIYDGPVDLLVHAYAPVILSKLPSLADGDAEIEPVSVGAGDLYLNPVTQNPDRLAAGKTYFPSGCRDLSCAQEYSEGEVEMDHLVARYELLPGITWSDGEALTADDSVFSFELDSDDTTASTKYLVQRTQSYEALDERTNEWVGIPGFLDPEFESNYWSPLPRHILGDFAAADLPDVEEAAKVPIGWGPYVIDSWVEDREIVLRKSETYFRSDEGLPYFDLLRIRFLGSDYESALEQVLTGECDVLDESVLPPSLWEIALQYASANRLQLASTPGNVMERIDFNISPASSLSPPSIFLDSAMREVVAACIDRQALAEDVFFGMTEVPQSYLPPSHPSSTSDTPLTELSVEQANARLDSMGWLDEDGDPRTPRIANGVVGVAQGQTLEIRYLTLTGFRQEEVVSSLKQDLSRCGIGIKAEYGNPDEIFEPWPNGPVFGGRFEAVGWAWPIFVTPPCEMFAGFEIPSVDYLYGINATGFRDEAYDSACRRIMNGPADGSDYVDAVSTTEEVFRSQLPSLPLYMRPRVMAFGSEICGPDPQNSAYSMLWNIESYRSGEACGG